MTFDFSSDGLFSQFPPWNGHASSGFHRGYLGEITDARFIEPGGRLFRKIGGSEDSQADRYEPGAYPPLIEEIFEWQALLAAVAAAQDRFVMIDAGAGFGRWLVSAVLALRRKTLEVPYFLIGVEAEPTHFAWMRQHLQTNGIDPSLQQLMQVAISGETGTAELLFGDDPASWYG